MRWRSPSCGPRRRSSPRSPRTPRRARRRAAPTRRRSRGDRRDRELQGDDCEAVGDVRRRGGRKGDVVVAIDACPGPAPRADRLRGEELAAVAPGRSPSSTRRWRERGADFAVFVVPSEDKLPGAQRPLREYNGDKLFVAYDPEDGSARARGRLRPGAGPRAHGPRRGRGLDTAAVRGEVERAVGAMEDVRRIKQQLTAAKTRSRRRPRSSTRWRPRPRPAGRDRRCSRGGRGRRRGDVTRRQARRRPRAVQGVFFRETTRGARPRRRVRLGAQQRGRHGRGPVRGRAGRRRAHALPRGERAGAPRSRRWTWRTPSQRSCAASTCAEPGEGVRPRARCAAPRAATGSRRARARGRGHEVARQAADGHDVHAVEAAGIAPLRRALEDHDRGHGAGA